MLKVDAPSSGMKCWVLPSGGTALIGMVGMGTLESGMSGKGHVMMSREKLRTQINS
jgi:hypothetical protein